MSAPPQIFFSSNVKHMDEWASRTGIPLTSAEALGTLYARAHNWLLALKDQLVRNHGFLEKAADPRMLFSIECQPPFRSSGGLPRTPPFNLQLPLHASTFFSPERRIQWEMVFHSALFPAMRHSCQPIADILHLLQCLLTGMLVLVKEEEVPGEGVWRTTRGLPPPEWVSANEAILLQIFGSSHYRKLFRAANDKRLAFKVHLEPPSRR
ncbi:uncharacterized protein FOMMEDRAFT_119268 [Fomitiporia mediterranea MF3/22]|uniref:uncharacterized protein n=1 Tax=Fomitiporia mediterranea (strain MF3/22) TaxID=694068 RepID=UPI0004408AF8|nr:uncharacterized protein FOMMEDRAFT_119268 [Fomitiporia mediterranea MF3/22]EJD05897.1 hypothetical protein FOMMEDRAFT_119268 [Fomitiporia mediterranea MF3/22]